MPAGWAGAFGARRGAQVHRRRRIAAVGQQRAGDRRRDQDLAAPTPKPGAWSNAPQKQRSWPGFAEAAAVPDGRYRMRGEAMVGPRNACAHSAMTTKLLST